MPDIHTPEQRLELKNAASEWWHDHYEDRWVTYFEIAHAAFAAGAEWQAKQEKGTE